MNISQNNLKTLIKAVYRILSEGRIYGSGNEPQGQISTEYQLTPDEILALKGMTHKERIVFALKKLKQARREKGQCISGGPNCEIPPIGKDGRPGPYCKKHLQSFRDARQRLAQKRGSCTRCPNPPLPGKKLCQNCIDELQARREKAIEQGICIKCFKNPAEPPLQVCRTCANKKSRVEQERRLTNPESEKERIKKRDLEYRKKHAADTKAYQQYRRDKNKAAKIGWDIEENISKKMCFGCYEDESFKNKLVPPLIEKLSVKTNSFIEKNDSTDNEEWHINYIQFKFEKLKPLINVIQHSLENGWYSLLWDDKVIYIIFSNGIAPISNEGTARAPFVSSITSHTELFKKNNLTNEYMLSHLKKALDPSKII